MLTTEQPLIVKLPHENAVLFHELQLGSELNECIHNERRADFILLLAMLTEDVREHSQFFVPKTNVKERDYSDEALRKAFHLPNKAFLALQKSTDIEKLSQSKLIVDQQLATMHLQDALTPRPLAFRDDANYITSNILSDTNIHCQVKIQQKVYHEKKSTKKELNDKEQNSKETSLNAAAFFNAKAWLDNIQNSLVNGSNVRLQTA
ncbi:MAG: hypothetical protein JKX78_04760 [Alteromonadaceae bacterium]|nr:hypothetical protein [Alteromonadaceae bacterium]